MANRIFDEPMSDPTSGSIPDAISTRVDERLLRLSVGVIRGRPLGRRGHLIPDQLQGELSFPRGVIHDRSQARLDFPLGFLLLLPFRFLLGHQSRERAWA